MLSFFLEIWLFLSLDLFVCVFCHLGMIYLSSSRVE